MLKGEIQGDMVLNVNNKNVSFYQFFVQIKMDNGKKHCFFLRTFFLILLSVNICIKNHKLIYNYHKLHHEHHEIN